MFIGIEPSGNGWAAFLKKTFEQMAVKTQIFTFKESDLSNTALPNNAVIRSARLYVSPDQVVYVDLFCSYPEPLDTNYKTHNFCTAVDGSYIDGDFVAYICPLFLPDGGIGGLFAIL